MVKRIIETALLLLLVAASGRLAARPPNIVLILADDLGRELLSSYGGQSGYETPTLDRMARTGMRFNTCYATPLCVPSRVELLTGRYSFRNYHSWENLDRSQRTFAQLLKRAGYATAMAGKWHPKGDWGKSPAPPAHAGFDAWCSYESDRLFAESKAFAGNRFWGGTILRNGKVERLNRYGPEVFSDFLVDFMKANRERPFLTYYCMNSMHRPFQPTPEHPDAPAPGQPAPREWRGSKGRPENFRPMLRYLDKMVGKLIRAVADLGLAEDTIIIFTSDNGTDNVADAKTIRSRFLNRDVKGGKYFPTELGVNVPLLAQWPGRVAAGQTCAELVDFTDLLPTLLDLAGTTPPEGYALDGRSILPLLDGRPVEPKEFTVTWGNYENNSRRYKDPINNPDKLLDVIRGPRFKYYSDGRLFDVQADLLEQSPLTAGKDDEADRARSRLQTTLKSIRRTNPRRW